MSLPAEQFKEIIRSLKSDGWVRRSIEKRSGPRVGLRCRLTIRPCISGRMSHVPTEVWLRDLSSNGIGIVHSQAIEEGQEFVAEFPLRNSDNLSVLYTVAHCKMLSRTLFSIGGKLTRIMSLSEDGRKTLAA